MLTVVVKQMHACYIIDLSFWLNAKEIIKNTLYFHIYWNTGIEIDEEAEFWFTI